MPPSDSSNTHESARPGQRGETGVVVGVRETKGKGGRQKGGGNQFRRRLAYGANVSGGLVLAVAVVLMLNVIGFLHLRDRYVDATAGRPHVLSQRTLAVLDELEGDYRLVALLDAADPGNRRRIELLELFNAASPALKVEAIDPASQFERHRAFERSLHEMFDSSLRPLRQAVEEAVEQLDAIVERTPPVLERLGAIENDELFTREPARPQLAPSQAATELREQVRAAQVRLRQLTAGSQGFVQARTALTEQLERPLPAYGELRNELAGHLRRARDEYDTLARRLRTAMTRPDRHEVAIADEARMLAIVAEPIAANLERALSRLERARPVEEYEQLLAMLAREDVLVLLGADRLRTVPFEPRPEDDARDGRRSEAERADTQSTDEARITGALARLEMLDNPPMAVFISASGTSPFGDNPVTSYRNVARRLVSTGFEVEQWIPFVAAGGGIGGPGERRTPPPQPRPGQRAVWVLLPDLDAGDVDGHMFETRMKDVLDHLRDRLAMGDGAMLITRRHDPVLAAQLGDAPSAILGFLEAWGLSPRLQQTIYRERRSYGRTMNESVFFIDRWPAGLAVSGALQAQIGRFGMPSPLELTSPDITGVRHHELVRIHGPDLRTDAGSEGGDPTRMRLDPATQRDAFLIAAAAEAPTGRVIAVAERFWATDRLTEMGRDPGAPAGTENYPANAELFVNSVCWLAGVDSLIAPSPMSLAVARIGPVEDDTRRALQWLLAAGLPAVILLAGSTMWLIRRRG